MWRIIGICFILLGSCGGVVAWYAGKKEKIHRIEDIIELLRRMAEAVERQTPMIHFLQGCSCRDGMLADAVGCMREELESNSWESGEEAWIEALGCCRQWNLNDEQWEALCGIGQVFGAAGRSAILDILFGQKKRWEEFLIDERRLMAQQQRVVFPVGMLSGVMLIILLI